jgi:hypothetical protein
VQEHRRNAVPLRFELKNGAWIATPVSVG